MQVDNESHGNTTEQYNVTMRRYACMALTNLTFGDGTNKALLCSMKGALEGLVAQLRSTNEDLCQVCVLSLGPSLPLSPSPTSVRCVSSLSLLAHLSPSLSLSYLCQVCVVSLSAALHPPSAHVPPLPASLPLPLPSPPLPLPSLPLPLPSFPSLCPSSSSICPSPPSACLSPTPFFLLLCAPVPSALLQFFSYPLSLFLSAYLPLITLPFSLFLYPSVCFSYSPLSAFLFLSHSLCLSSSLCLSPLISP